jgi:hypothetical protein
MGVAAVMAVEGLEEAGSTAVVGVDFTVEEAGSTAAELLAVGSIPVAASAVGLQRHLQATALAASVVVHGLVGGHLHPLGAVSHARVAREEVTPAGCSAAGIHSQRLLQLLTAAGMLLAASRDVGLPLRDRQQDRAPVLARASAPLAEIALLALPA